MSPALTHLESILARARQQVAKVVIGQDDVVSKALIAILTRQHALIVGVPGVAKTLLVRTLARVLGSEFSRIQFTPDLMPADITGTNVFNLQTNSFSLIPGPVFTTFLLADEINRAPAKTQSALLQAMQERMVTIDRDTYPLDPRFTVFATQNPVEHEGTYPLPEAQKDRFMLEIQMGCPGEADERELARRMLVRATTPEQILATGDIEMVLDGPALETLEAALEEVVIRPELIDYIVAVVRRTREHEAILVGAGPRATQSLLAASRVQAALEGRDFVTPDDVKTLAEPILAHRLMLRPEFEIEGVTIREALGKVLEETPIPQ